jgi:hypothetical protein
MLSKMLVTTLAAVAVATGAARAATTVNYADQWWIPAESGWGASVLQQNDILFIDLFVYGTDSKPTWFTVAAFAQGGAPSGHTVFAGDLYATVGPYYGGPFSTSDVQYTKVGSLTFDADSATTARISYTVNGAPVVKSVTRQTWRYQSMNGEYVGAIVFSNTGCVNPADNGPYVWFGRSRVEHRATDNTVTITSTGVGGTPGTATLSGTYSQLGHMGQIDGQFQLAPGEPGTAKVTEIEVGPDGMVYRFVAAGLFSNCQSSGRAAAARR